MDPATALTPALAALTEALDDPDLDLEIMLDSVGRQVVTVVPSFLGLTITVHSSGIAVTVSTVSADAARSAGACLLLGLKTSGANQDSVVFFAAAPGAFSGLIAATDPAEPRLSRVFVLDQHMPFIADLPHAVGIVGLDEFSAHNRAVGALIAEGCVLDPAISTRAHRVPIPAQPNPLKPSCDHLGDQGLGHH